MALTDKLTNIADAIRGKTGKTEEMTLDQMATEIAGIEAGGGETFPQKFYETDFVVEEHPANNAVVCTISTGLSVNYVKTDNEFLLAIITCSPLDSTYDYPVRAIQEIYPNQGGAGVNPTTKQQRGDGVRFARNSGVRITACGVDLSTLTLSARHDTTYGVAGNYHLELYRTGVTV